MKGEEITSPQARSADPLPNNDIQRAGFSNVEIDGSGPQSNATDDANDSAPETLPTSPSLNDRISESSPTTTKVTDSVIRSPLSKTFGTVNGEADEEPARRKAHGKATSYVLTNDMYRLNPVLPRTTSRISFQPRRTMKSEPDSIRSDKNPGIITDTTPKSIVLRDLQNYLHPRHSVSEIRETTDDREHYEIASTYSRQTPSIPTSIKLARHRVCTVTASVDHSLDTNIIKGSSTTKRGFTSRDELKENNDHAGPALDKDQPLPKPEALLVETGRKKDHDTAAYTSSTTEAVGPKK